MKRLPDANHFSAALATLFVSYGSSAVIIFQAAQSFGATATQTASWFTALGLVCGLLTVALSLRHRTPVIIAWCTPGAAMLAGSQGSSMAEAVGAFVFAALLMLALALSGGFDRLVRHIPPTLAAAMLAGILINFGSGIFVGMQHQTLLIGLMLTVYLSAKIRTPRYAVLFMLAAGLGYATVGGLVDWTRFQAAPPHLEWVAPVFDAAHFIGIGIPLFIVTLATQNMPGIAVLRAYGYHDIPAKTPVAAAAAASAVTAPLGVFAVNLAAISSALCMGEEVDRLPERRYLATVWLGIMYLLLGLAGGMIVSLFAALPAELLTGLAGIAVLSTLQSNLIQAWQDEATREASLLTLLASASGMNLLGIGSAFWGLLLGSAVYALNRRVASSKQ